MNSKTIQRAVTTAVILGGILMTGCNNSAESGKAPVQSDTHVQHAAHVPDHNPPQPDPAPVNSEPAQSIPDFKFYKLRSGFGYEKSDIPTGKNTVFILFDPSCRYCQVKAGELANNYDKLKDVTLLFVSMNDPALMDKFLSTHGAALEGKNNVEILYDRDQQFMRQFHLPPVFPANYVYGPDGKLKSHWSGEKDIQEMLKAFTQ